MPKPLAEPSSSLPTLNCNSITNRKSLTGSAKDAQTLLNILFEHVGKTYVDTVLD